MKEYLFSPSELGIQAAEMTETIKTIVTSRNMVNARLEELRQTELEIYHEMERPRCLYKDRAKLATKLSAVLKERRELKDWLHINRQILAFADSDKYTNLTRLFSTFLGETRKSAKVELQMKQSLLDREE